MLPYRDVAVFNFPGQIELFWLLGKCFGWGRTTPIYVVDSALLLVLGLVMSAWSRRSFGRCSPGLVGFVAFLYYYLSLDYAVVAQRDWQGPLLVVLGMMLVQAWPGLAATMGSGLLFGLALVIRPHVLLFTPAVALVVAMSVPASSSAGPAAGAPRSSAARAEPRTAGMGCGRGYGSGRGLRPARCARTAWRFCAGCAAGELRSLRRVSGQRGDKGDRPARRLAVRDGIPPSRSRLLLWLRPGFADWRCPGC